MFEGATDMADKAGFPVFFVASLLMAAAPAAAATFTTVAVQDYPTNATGINDAGDVTGVFVTGHGDHLAWRGFIRHAGGSLDRFLITKVTQPAAINEAGEVTGTYANPGDRSRGFLRRPNGKIVLFDVGDIRSNSTQPIAINSSGVVLARLAIGTRTWGVLRAPGGAVTKFQMANDDSGNRPDTTPTGINADSTVVGYSTNIDFLNRGFIRSPDGTITMFDVAAAGSGRFQGTFPTAVNSLGTVAGYYIDSDNVAHGFSRTSDGAVTTFDVEGASGETVVGLNDEGTIAGIFFTTSDNFPHGFVRAPARDITTFDAPGETRGTMPIGINNGGQVVGLYYGDSTVHSFVRTP
jgi:hypothetical protein